LDVALPFGGNYRADVTGGVEFGREDNGSPLISSISFDRLLSEGGEPPRFKYIELRVGPLPGKRAAIHVWCAEGGGGLFEVRPGALSVGSGRNFIELPESPGYTRLRVSFQPGQAAAVSNVSVSSRLPLRIRHVAVLGAAGLLWCALCYKMLKGNALSLAQISNLRRYSNLLANLVKNDFALKYRRSLLGILWSVLNPLFMAAIVTAVFNSLFRVQTEHFAVYYLTGSLIFSLASEATQGALSSVLGSSGLIKKVYIPKYIFPVEKCLFALVNTTFSFVALLILMPALGVYPTATWLLFFVPFLYALAFSIGLGLALAATNVFFRDIGHLYGIWIVAWMYLTPIIYPVDILPAGLQSGLAFNPLHHFVAYFRQIMMYGTLPGLRENLTCAVFSLAALLLGVIIFKKTQDRFILYV
ncbi:MAG: ABC transporter permease, partial [Clostridiales bacterium]|nr:ABC transporter permease [Clostridiales bacterium]